MTKEVIESTVYDDVPYESNPFSQTHPQRLAAMARLFGLSPAPVEKCRVLELGCASGGNIIPVAFNLPESEFVGVDLAMGQVKMGRETIEALGIDNMRMEHASILDVDKSWGEFDYIIAHGVFSWVPQKVREKILDIALENLSENGVAYISYNVYPGWHMRGMIRHMMLYHTAQFEDQTKKVQQARALVDFLSNSVPKENNYFGLLLNSEMDIIKKSQDYYLFHDHLEVINTPMYFHEFAEMAAKRDLAYLGESDFSTMLTSGFSKKVADTLKRISKNIIQTEQYMDFVRNRFFRQTLLCRKGREINRNISPGNLTDFLFVSSAKAEKKNVDYSEDQKTTFKTPKGPSITTNRPLTKAALTILQNIYPKAIGLDELLDQAAQLLKDKGIKDNLNNNQKRQILTLDFLQCITVNLVEFLTWQADFVTKVSDKPKASRLAITQSRSVANPVNQCHQPVPLNVAVRNMIPLLDGTRDRNGILKGMIELAKKGTLIIKQNNKPITDENFISKMLEKVMDEGLAYLAKNAMLIE